MTFGDFARDWFIAGVIVATLVAFADRIHSRWKDMPLNSPASRAIGFALALILWPIFLFRLLWG